jgi:hypothetical protein
MKNGGAEITDDYGPQDCETVNVAALYVTGTVS